jgi:uncharacterized protein YdbL (DUF1318 family)
MKYSLETLSALAAGTLLIGGVGVALAQNSMALISQALAAGEIGEQSNGYMGFRESPSAALRAEVDALNIKRRAAYQALAEQKGKSLDVVAATGGCETLQKRVMPGRAYKLNDGVWRVRGAAPIPVPSYCGKDDS